MNAYSTIRNTGLATIAVAVLAGFITSGLAADQRNVYRRAMPEAAAVAVLPEIVVSASRLPT
ncbi:MAG: hypothetical protein ACREIV_01900 [Planctomycetaceae bacterium]